MSTFTIHTLGCGSAKPTVRHQPSSTVVDHHGNLYMVDCGEGAQQAFQRQRLRFPRLQHIFLTHLHGDHVLGLPGLIGTLGLQQRGGCVTIHTFEEGAAILRKILDFFCQDDSLEVKFNIIDPKRAATVLGTRSLRVRTIPLRHRVPCVGYVFEEFPGPAHLRRDMADFHGVPVWMFNRIKGGEDFVKPDGTVVPNSVLTFPASAPKSYAHISDTAVFNGEAEAIGPVDLLFHETTYTDANEKDARPRGHSTARQAAKVARDAGARRLLTGHYSSRYRDESQFLKEASEEFPGEVILNNEGLSVDI